MSYSERSNVEAGDLDKRVTIEAVTMGAADSRGRPAVTWAAAVNDVSARIETPSGRKLELTRQLVATATHLVTIRYRPGMSEQNHRIASGVMITTLNGAINDSTTTVIVASALAIALQQVIQIGAEQMQVTGIAGATLTVTRGFNGTTRAAHATGANVLKRRIFNIGWINDIEERHVKLELVCTEERG